MADREYELGYDHPVLRTHVTQLQAAEKVVNALRNQRRALSEDLPEVLLAASDALIEDARPVVAKMKRQLPRYVRGSPLGEWIQETTGLGPGLILLLGTLPPLPEFDTVSAIWKYVGLHVVDGSAVKAERGKRLGFDRRRRAYAIARVAEPIIKVGGPYREVYDDRRAHTMETHPPMWVLEEDGSETEELQHPACPGCAEAILETDRHREARNLQRERQSIAWDCSDFGGPHWKNGHRHADALRVTAKAVLRDAYRVSIGQLPRVGRSEGDEAPDGSPDRQPAGIQ